MKNLMKFIILISVVTLIGCQAPRDNVSAPTKDGNQNLVNVKNSSPTERENLNNTEIATHLSNIAAEIPDVNDAASLVAGPYAVVGIDIDQDLDRQRVGTTKYSVTEALRNDPYGKTALVVADADMMERIRNMGEEIQQGRPIRGVLEELAEIVNRYMPDMPVEEDKNVDPEPENQLRDGNEEELKRIQEEQSDDQMQNQHQE